MPSVIQALVYRLFDFFLLKLLFLTLFLTVVPTALHDSSIQSLAHVEGACLSLDLLCYYIASTEAVVFYLKDPMQSQTHIGFAL